jgi:hypothetical protein
MAGRGGRAFIAVLVVTGVLTAAPWLMLAYVAWRQRHYTVAIAVLCAQMVLPVEYGAIATQAAQGTGAAVGGIGAALFFSRARAPLKFLVFGALGASALCLYRNSVFLIDPAGACVFLTHWRSRKLWMWCVAPVIGVGLLYARALRSYTRHPEYVLHAQWPIDWTWPNFHDATNNLDRHLGDLTPTLFHAGGFLILGIALVAWLTLLTRSVRPMLASSVLGLGVLASLGISKLHDGGVSSTLPYSRAFYSYPFAIMWLTVMWADAIPALNSSAAKRAGVVAALTMLGVGVWREAALTLRWHVSWPYPPPPSRSCAPTTCSTIAGGCARLPSGTAPIWCCTRTIVSRRTAAARSGTVSWTISIRPMTGVPIACCVSARSSAGGF